MHTNHNLINEVESNDSLVLIGINWLVFAEPFTLMTALCTLLLLLLLFFFFLFFYFYFLAIHDPKAAPDEGTKSFNFDFSYWTHTKVGVVTLIILWG